MVFVIRVQKDKENTQFHSCWFLFWVGIQCIATCGGFTCFWIYSVHCSNKSCCQSHSYVVHMHPQPCGQIPTTLQHCASQNYFLTDLCFSASDSFCWCLSPSVCEDKTINNFILRVLISPMTQLCPALLFSSDQ